MTLKVIHMLLAYTEDCSHVVTNHGINQHAYADDNQLYTSCLPSDVALARQRLSECTDDLLMWSAKRRLQLNASKTEILLVGSKYNLAKLAGEGKSHYRHGNNTTVWCCPWLKCLARLRVVAETASHRNCQKLLLAATTTASSASTCRSWSYHASGPCTSHVQIRLLQLSPCWLPTSTLYVLLKVQNASARLIYQLRPWDHVGSSLQQLHWLPIRSRVLYKQCLLMYKVNHGQSPKYISDQVTHVSTVAATATRSSLRSAKTTSYHLPRLRTKFGERAFSYLQRETSSHKTFEPRPHWTVLNENWRRTVLQKFLVAGVVNVWQCNTPAAYVSALLLLLRWWW